MSARAVTIALLLGACGDNLPSPFDDPSSIEVVSMPVTPNRELDLLFLIDDSPGGSELEDLLSDSFPLLVDQLSPDGELVNLHLASVRTTVPTS